MAVYNEEIEEINESIKSVLEQNYKNIEFIIIDDNPQREDIIDFLNRMVSYDDRVRVIFNEYNKGQSESRNVAIKQSTSDYIAIMDADDISVSTRISKQIKFMKKHNLDLSFSNFSIIDNHFNVTRSGTFGNKDIYSQMKIKKILSSHSISLGPTFMIKKSSFEKTGGYRQMNVEDYDLSTRMIVKGFRLGYISESLLKKKLRTNSISYKSLYTQYVITKKIAETFRKSHYKKCIEDNVIKNIPSNIDHKDIENFQNYKNSRYSFNDKKDFLNLFKLILSIFTSVVVIKFIIWSIKNRIVRIFV
ncbi:MAG: glycosyltransferase [Staphylococcus epidermidis]|nr:glycosyltransferase [Staphylococcus epidermidis]